MPWARVVGPEPPDEFTMNHWEGEGWSQISVLGPCPTVDGKTGKAGAIVYVVYLYRSIIAGPNAKRPGWPIGRRKGAQPATSSGIGPRGKLN